MITFAQKEDTEQIKRLWRKTFDDTEEEIEAFLKYYSENIMIYKEDRRVKGMLSLLPLSLNSEKGRYVYAAATEPEDRNRGINSKLLEHAYKDVKKKGESFLLLVPAEKSLYEYYEKRGFAELCAVKKIEYDRVGFVNKDTSIRKIQPEEYYEARHEFFSKEKFIEWGRSEIEYIWKIYKGNFFEISNGEDVSYAVCDAFEGLTDIKELFGTVENDECIAAIHGVLTTPHVRAAILSKEVPSAMVYPKKYKNCFFNLAMD